jgi:hypothetical protein
VQLRRHRRATARRRSVRQGRGLLVYNGRCAAALRRAEARCRCSRRSNISLSGATGREVTALRGRFAALWCDFTVVAVHVESEAGGEAVATTIRQALMETRQTARPAVNMSWTGFYQIPKIYQ